MGDRLGSLLGETGFLKSLGMGDRLGSLLGEDGFCKKFFDCKTAGLLSVKKNILFIDIFAIYVGRSGAEKCYLCSHGVDDFDSV